MHSCKGNAEEKQKCGNRPGEWGIGTVVGFTENMSKITQVLVEFEWLDRTIPVCKESCTFEVLKGVFYTRKQFPLMLAFAVTIHKSQGLSMQSVIIDAGSSCFGTGMVYVALSRVTALNGLHLLSLDTNKIVCDRKALHEYNSLREKFMPHLGKLLNTDVVDNSDQPTTSSDSIRVSPAQHLQPNDAETDTVNKDKYEEENESNNLANATATNQLTTANTNII